MLKKIIDNIDVLADYFVIAFITTLAGTLVIKEWRTNPNFAVAGLLVGPILGFAAQNVFGEGAGIIITFAGTIMGPGLIIMLQSEDAKKDLYEAIKNRWSKK